MEGIKIFSILIVICLVTGMLARESTALSALRRLAMWIVNCLSLLAFVQSAVENDA